MWPMWLSCGTLPPPFPSTRPTYYLLPHVQEEEAIKVLEFQARQRMWALEQEAVRTAMQAKLREEVGAWFTNGCSRFSLGVALQDHA